ncbi:MAG: hypothetical protein KF822_09560 [Steroidobacteraceae bacterium]|nr:hypothetical protein [Steroidobacteraceae bacterium]
MDRTMPPKPEPFLVLSMAVPEDTPVYSDDQLDAYALSYAAELRAENERLARSIGEYAKIAGDLSIAHDRKLAEVRQLREALEAALPLAAEEWDYAFKDCIGAQVLAKMRAALEATAPAGWLLPVKALGESQ